MFGIITVQEKKLFCPFNLKKWVLFDVCDSSGCPWAQSSTVSSGGRSSSQWIKTWSERTAATSSLEERITRMWRSWGQIFFFILTPSSSYTFFQFQLLNPSRASNEFHALLTQTQPSDDFWCILRANGFLNERQEDLNSVLLQRLLELHLFICLHWVKIRAARSEHRSPTSHLFLRSLADESRTLLSASFSFKRVWGEEAGISVLWLHRNHQILTLMQQHNNTPSSGFWVCLYDTY